MSKLGSICSARSSALLAPRSILLLFPYDLADQGPDVRGIGSMLSRPAGTFRARRSGRARAVQRQAIIHQQTIIRRSLDATRFRNFQPDANCATLIISLGELEPRPELLWRLRHRILPQRKRARPKARCADTSAPSKTQQHRRFHHHALLPVQASQEFAGTPAPARGTADTGAAPAAHPGSERSKRSARSAAEIRTRRKQASGKRLR